jgi:hypothetical protein
MDAALVTAWKDLCQLLSPAFTEPTLGTFEQLATAWAMWRGRPTGTNLIRLIGPSLLGEPAKHWTTYERLFYRAAWSPEEVSRVLLTQVVQPLLPREQGKVVVNLNADDTTCVRNGKHVAYAGRFRDASISNAQGPVFRWSHNWVIGALALEPQGWPGWVVSLPVQAALYRKEADCDKSHPFASKQQMVATMIRQTRESLPQALLRVAVDGGYASRDVVQEIRAQVSRGHEAMLVSRIRKDAAIYELPQPQSPSKPGPRPKKGKRLSTPEQWARSKEGWQTIQVNLRGRCVTRQVLAVTCLWYRVSQAVPIKMVIVRDPTGRQEDDYLFCTDPGVSERDIIERFADRWPIETSIFEGKQFNGMEQVQGWCPRTVQRQVPLALILQTLVKVWYLTQVAAGRIQPATKPAWGWMPPKDHPSYQDILAVLRQALWEHRISSNSRQAADLLESLEALRFALCAA